MIDLQGVFLIEYTPPGGGRPRALAAIRNGPTLEGVNYLLDAAFRGRARPSQWYCGLISGSGYGSISENDTMSSHAGWTEFTNGGSPRKVWAPASASGGLVGSTTNFTLAAVGDILGVFLTSESTGSAGLLYSTAIDVNGGITVAPAGTYPGGIGYPPQVGGTISITYNLRLRPRS